MSASAEAPTPTRVENDAAPQAPPFKGPFFQELGKRKRTGRDAKILVTADHGATGVGKTACGVFLAKAIDTSPSGYYAEEKATLDVQEFLSRYQVLPPGSASILDEAEQLDARRAMSHENVDASQEWQMRRVDEIFALLILPSPRVIDERMEMLADYWVNVEARGRAKIYKKKVQRMPPRNVYYETMQTFKWPNMDGDEDYQILSRMKDDHLDDDKQNTNWVRESEVQKRVKDARKEARKEVRDEVIQRLYSVDSIKSQAIAEAVELSDSRVRQIASEA